MKRCLSTGNLSGDSSTNDSFATVVPNKKPKKGRPKNQISATQPITVNNDDSGYNPLIEMDSITLGNDHIQALNDQYVKKIMDLNKSSMISLSSLILSSIA
jgi:hypothetical protein